MRTQGSESLGTYLPFVTVRHWTRDGRRYSPCDRLDLRDFAGIQQGVCGAAERGPDIESDNELS